jgi:hypothetical protein
MARAVQLAPRFPIAGSVRVAAWVTRVRDATACPACVPIRRVPGLPPRDITRRTSPIRIPSHGATPLAGVGTRLAVPKVPTLVRPSCEAMSATQGPGAQRPSVDFFVGDRWCAALTAVVASRSTVNHLWRPLLPLGRAFPFDPSWGVRPKSDSDLVLRATEGPCRPSPTLMIRVRSWSLRQSDQSVASPAHRRKPSAGREVARVDRVHAAASCRWAPRTTFRDGWAGARAGTKAAPTVEPSCGRKRIDPDPQRTRRVLPKIREHVNERVPHFPRRTKGAPVPPLRPQPSAAGQNVVDVTSDSNCDTAHPARKRALIRCFDDQVHVVALHGKMHDAKAFSRLPACPRKRKPHHRKIGTDSGAGPAASAA